MCKIKGTETMDKFNDFSRKRRARWVGRILETRDSDPVKYATLDQAGSIWDYPVGRAYGPKIKWLAQEVSEMWNRHKVIYGPEDHEHLAYNKMRPYSEVEKLVLGKIKENHRQSRRLQETVFGRKEQSMLWEAVPRKIGATERFRMDMELRHGAYEVIIDERTGKTRCSSCDFPTDRCQCSKGEKHRGRLLHEVFRGKRGKCNRFRSNTLSAARRGHGIQRAQLCK